MAKTEEQLSQEIADEKRKLGIGDDTQSDKEKSEQDDIEEDTSQKGKSEEDDDNDADASKKSETDDTTKKDTDLSHSRRKSPIAEVKDEYKEIIKSKDTEIADLKGKLEKLSTENDKDNPDADKLADLEGDIKAAAERMGLKPEALAEIVSLARKGLEIPKDKLAFIDKAAQDAVEAEEVAFFSKEWSDVLPSLREEYPNATDEQLNKAKAEMERLARHTSEEYARYELPYILFKHKQDFDKMLFSPKKKGLESSTDRPDLEDDADGLKPLSPTTSLSPREVAKREAAMNALARKDSEPLRITDAETGQDRFER